jgi:phosphoglycerol transferase MdoB-like AlkP superfamily enzyme
VTGCDATFDNMKGFFESNGFDVVGRREMARGEVTQETAWGACDGDVFAKTLKECDAAHSHGKKFFAAVLTGSNHQPFTVPPKFDPLGEKTRAVAVRYADRAIGDFVAAARSKPWFGDTIFVFVADHCANCAGRAVVSPGDFHIPAVIYAPSIVAPGQVDAVASQIDLMPTVLGLMNFRYESRFFGRDALKGGEGRAVLSNYQDLAWLEGGRLVLLRGEKRKMLFLVEPSGNLRECADDPAFVFDAISCFQTASEYIRSQLLIPEPGPGFFAGRTPR